LLLIHFPHSLSRNKCNMKEDRKQEENYQEFLSTNCTNVTNKEIEIFAPIRAIRVIR